jgi:hypothetical protein
VTFVAMLQIQISLRTHSPLKSVMFPKNLRFELTELHYDPILRSSLNHEALIAFYASLQFPWSFELRKLARNWASVFGRTFTCEQAPTHMKLNKYKCRPIIAVVHLRGEELAFQKRNQIFILFRSNGSPQRHFNKVHFGYFYCYVQFCVGRFQHS